MTGSWWTSTERVAIPSGRTVAGRARLPGSKSLTHRGCALALLARSPVRLSGALDAEDTRLFFDALTALGFAVERRGADVTLTPTGRSVASAELFVGNAGTLFRLLVALVATIPGEWTIDGSERLRERPVGPLADALVDLGVEIDWLGRRGHAPLAIAGGTLLGGATYLDAGESSQYLSALLLAGQRATREIEIEVPALVSAPYVELTVELLLAHGGTVERPSETLWRTAPSALTGGTVAIEPDLSAAAYPAAAATLAGGEILLEGASLDSKQGDRRFLELLARMGARVERQAGRVRVVGAGALTAIEDDLSDIPDQVPTLAALAPFARGTTRIANVAHLRVKESDRLAAMAAELRRAGAAVEELADGLVIPGVWAETAPPGEPVTIDPHGDHRIAMAMAVAALRRPRLAIAEPGVVDKSWPGFFAELAGWIGERP